MPRTNKARAFSKNTADLIECENDLKNFNAEHLMNNSVDELQALQKHFTRLLKLKKKEQELKTKYDVIYETGFSRVKKQWEINDDVWHETDGADEINLILIKDNIYSIENCCGEWFKLGSVLVRSDLKLVILIDDDDDIVSLLADFREFYKNIIDYHLRENVTKIYEADLDRIFLLSFHIRMYILGGDTKQFEPNYTTMWDNLIFPRLYSEVHLIDWLDQKLWDTLTPLHQYEMWKQKKEYDQEKADEASADYNPNTSSPYQTLGLKIGASQKEIKKKYRKLLLKYHPDKNGSKDAEQITKNIIKAYKLLS
jgi:hypothetical protein